VSHEHEINHIDLTIEVIDNKLARLEAEKRRLLARRAELVRRRGHDS